MKEKNSQNKDGVYLWFQSSLPRKIKFCKTSLSRAPQLSLTMTSTLIYLQQETVQNHVFNNYFLFSLETQVLDCFFVQQRIHFKSKTPGRMAHCGSHQHTKVQQTSASACVAPPSSSQLSQAWACPPQLFIPT